MRLKTGTAHYGWMFHLLAVVQICLLTSRPARADRRCPLPQPIAVGDTPLEAPVLTEDQLPPEVREAVFNLVPKDFVISRIVKSNFSRDENVNDYLVFYWDYDTSKTDPNPRLLIARQDPTRGVRVFPVLRVGMPGLLGGYIIKNAPNGWPELPLLADIQSDDLIVFRHSSGAVYAKTIGYKLDYCWETIISWQSDRFIAEHILFGTTDGFNYPVNSARYPADIQTADRPSGWKIAVEFQDPNPAHYIPGENPKTHLGEDWNDINGSNSDLGHPVFAIGRGEVIFAGNGGTVWNGIVILRHRPPTGKDVFSFYAHLNIDPSAKRDGIGGDKSKIRTVNEILQQSAPGHIVEVEKGQLIGYIGPTPKYSTSPHLHFEIIVNPDVVYGTNDWKIGYLPLNGKEDRWTNPSKFIEENRTYWRNFTVGQSMPDLPFEFVPPEVFKECYGRNGGLVTMGRSISVALPDYSPLTETSAQSQVYENGEILFYWDGQYAGHTFGILNPLLAKFRILAPPRNCGGQLEQYGCGPAYAPYEPLGLPVADVTPATESSSYKTKFKFQNFEGGALEFHQTGPYAGDVFEIHGAIFKRWSGPELNYAIGPLGLPISDEKEAAPSPISGLTGRYSVFEGGVIHWVREQDKTYVIGLNQKIGGQSIIGKLIADRYHAEGGSGGALGFPTSDDYLWQDGVRSDFENGCIIWTPSGGIQVAVFKK